MMSTCIVRPGLQNLQGMGGLEAEDVVGEGGAEVVEAALIMSTNIITATAATSTKRKSLGRRTGRNQNGQAVTFQQTFTTTPCTPILELAWYVVLAAWQAVLQIASLNTHQRLR